MQFSYWENQHFINKADLVVIGSGIVGLNAAIAFKKKYPKKQVTIIEKGILPSGASTKNAGFACIGSVSELSDDLLHIDEQSVWDTVQLRNSGLVKLRQLIGDKNMNYLHFGGFEVFDSKKEFEENEQKIHEYNQKLKSITGIEKTFRVNKNKIRNSGFKDFKYCIENRAEGQINTGLMMRNLLHLAHLNGILIINNTEVFSIHDNGDYVEMACSNNLILKSKKLIVAINGFAKKLLKIKDVEPARAQVLITHPIKNLKVKGSFHYQSGYYYFRNIDNRILFGGGRNLDFKTENTAEFGLTPIIQKKLESILRYKILPNEKFSIDQRWSGIMGVGSEKKPIIKSISPNVVCAVRMGGMGVAIGSLVGEMAVKELLHPN
jgi:gamma-glutamylputrescine oxidase